MLRQRFRTVSSALLAIALFVPAANAQQAEQAEAVEGLRFLRVTGERFKRLSLEVAVQEFIHPTGDGPRVALAGVAHIGDGELYTHLQKLLDDYDIVLYEAVTPAGVGRPQGRTDEERAESTQQALRFIAAIAEAHHEQNGRYPGDAGELQAFIDKSEAIAVNWFKDAMTDAWGNVIDYQPIDGRRGFRVVSLGADGLPGGDGFDADLVVDHEDDVDPFQIERDNIQHQLAEALGLSYQLAVMDYTAPNWRNSDMNMAELAVAFRERGLDFGEVEAMSGSGGFPAALAKMLLGLVSWLDDLMDGAFSDMAKVLMIEVLGNAAILEESMEQMGRGFGEVIINERNKVTIEDLKAIMRDEPDVKSVAIFYGAAHMDDFAKRLADLGYEPGEVRWVRAISWHVENSSLHPRQVMEIRRMIRQMLREQMRQMRLMNAE